MTDNRVANNAIDPDSEFTGKYEEAGRISGFLIDRFYDAVRRLLMPHVSSGSTVLEIGCGAGYSSQRILQWLPDGVDYIGSDIGTTLLDKALTRNPGVRFVQQSVYDLQLPDQSVDSVVMLEVLEHLEDPDAALREVRRVVRRGAVVSTPREPLWRALNFARGKYMGDFGNTPGHIQHWSSRGLKRQVSSYFRVVASAQPVPWTVLSLTPHP